mgnify:CR=1 FL=1
MALFVLLVSPQLAQAQLQLAEIDLANTVIKAPANGHLGEVGVRLGQFVSAGTQLMALVPEKVWVVANFKEQQIAQMRVGQPVRVLARTRTLTSGVAVPLAAVTRNPANQHSLWIKTAPEQFSPRLVTTVALDGQRLMVTSGLTGGELVVVAGANLINQVR